MFIDSTPPSTQRFHEAVIRASNGREEMIAAMPHFNHPLVDGVLEVMAVREFFLPWNVVINQSALEADHSSPFERKG